MDFRNPTNWRQQTAAWWTLHGLAGDVAVPGYWIDVHREEEEHFGKGCNVHLFTYVGSTFCEPCADATIALIDRFLGEDDDDERTVWKCLNDGESDSCQHCDICGKLLQYSLTDYGAEAELEHFESLAPNPTVYPDDAYHLGQLVQARWDGAVQDIVQRALARPAGVR